MWKEARDSAEQWLLERNKEAVTWGHKGERVVLTGDAAKREQEKRERQAQQATKQRKAYLAELELALEHERFGDVRGLLRATSQLPDSDVFADPGADRFPEEIVPGCLFTSPHWRDHPQLPAEAARRFGVAETQLGPGLVRKLPPSLRILEQGVSPP